MKIDISENTELALHFLDRLVSQKTHAIKANDFLKQLQYRYQQPFFAILSLLAEAGIIKLHSNIKNVIELQKHPGKVSVMDVIDAIDGDTWRNQCLLRHTPCGDLRNCPVHDFWKKQRSQIEHTLSHVTLEQWIRFEHRDVWRQAQVVH